MRYLGCKDLLVDDIVSLIQERCEMSERTVFFDAFCGTGAVAVAMSSYCRVVINDILKCCTTYTKGRLCNLHKQGTCPSQRPLLRYLRFLSAKDQACPQLTLLALQSGSAHPFELYFLHLVVSVVIRPHRAFYGMIKSRFGEKFVGHSYYLFQRDILFFLKTQKFIFRNSPSNIPHIP